LILTAIGFIWSYTKDKEMIDSRIIVPANQVDDEFVYSRPGTSNEIRAKFKKFLQKRLSESCYNSGNMAEIQKTILIVY